jgi:hypothetical protein
MFASARLGELLDARGILADKFGRDFARAAKEGSHAVVDPEVPINFLQPATFGQVYWSRWQPHAVAGVVIEGRMKRVVVVAVGEEVVRSGGERGGEEEVGQGDRRRERHLARLPR